MDPFEQALELVRRRPAAALIFLRPSPATIVARYLAHGLPRNAG